MTEPQRIILRMSGPELDILASMGGEMPRECWSRLRAWRASRGRELAERERVLVLEPQPAEWRRKGAAA